MPWSVRIGPYELARKAAGQDLVTHIPASRGWYSILSTIREQFTGAWQRGLSYSGADVLTHPIFFACTTLIAGDIAKLRPAAVQKANGIATEIEHPAYSPVLRRPNHYQNRIQSNLYWILSKLTRGNAYALKERDADGNVDAYYVLDSSRVQPVVSPSGDVYYVLGQDLLSGITETSLTVPARDIIHDLMYPLYHPLCGLSPVFACGHVALQGLKIMENTSRFADNGSMLGGLLVAPGTISEQTANKLEEHWNNNYAGAKNAGKVAAIGDGLKFEKPPVMTAVDAQIIEQLKWGDEKVCSVFHVPGWMVGVGEKPNYNTSEALTQQYYSQCLQLLIESLELCLSEGLDMPVGLDVAFDLAGLIRMDGVQKMDAATKGVIGGVFSPNEARAQFNLKPVAGGESPYLQQQNYSLAALAARDKNPAPNTPAPSPALPAAPAKDFTEFDEARAGVMARGHLLDGAHV